RRPKRPEEKGDEHDRLKVLIETRGQGGFIVAAPSHGSVHSSGNPYRLRRGGVETNLTHSPQEREALHELARTFDEMPRPGPRNDGTRDRNNGGIRPGDDFNARARWNEILESRGWIRIFERGGETYWRRPGKPDGISATTGYQGS